MLPGTTLTLWIPTSVRLFPCNFAFAGLVIPCIPTTTLLSTGGQRHNFLWWFSLYRCAFLLGCFLCCRLSFLLILDDIFIPAQPLGSSIFVNTVIIYVVLYSIWRIHAVLLIYNILLGLSKPDVIYLRAVGIGSPPLSWRVRRSMRCWAMRTESCVQMV